MGGESDILNVKAVIDSKKSQILTYKIMNNREFNDNMIFIKDMLLAAISNGPNIISSNVYYNTLFGDPLVHHFRRGIMDVRFADKIIEELKSFEELRGYEINTIEYNDYIVGLSIELL